LPGSPHAQRTVRSAACTRIVKLDDERGPLRAEFCRKHSTWVPRSVIPSERSESRDLLSSTLFG
jgi:hypothetical protein